MRRQILIVALDEKCDGPDVNEIASAVERLRGVQHVKPFSDYSPDTPIEALDLPTRLQNTLLNGQITTLGRLTARGRQELSRLKNLGKQGLREIEARLKLLGLQLQPQTPEQDPARQQQAARVMVTFKETRLALRRLWRAVEGKRYTTQDWQDWQQVDRTLRQYARETAVQAGIDPREVDKHIAAWDTEPFLQTTEP